MYSFNSYIQVCDSLFIHLYIWYEVGSKFIFFNMNISAWFRKDYPIPIELKRLSYPYTIDFVPLPIYFSIALCQEGIGAYEAETC